MDQDQACRHRLFGPALPPAHHRGNRGGPLLLDCPYDIVTSLPDGRRAVLTGDDRYYVAKDDGWPDWDQPVHIPGLSPEPPRDGDLIIR